MYLFYFFCSEFSDIFDLERFKSVLADDVKIVSLLPANKIMTRPTEDGGMPFNASPQWIRSHYLKRVSLKHHHPLSNSLLWLPIWFKPTGGWTSDT